MLKKEEMIQNIDKEVEHLNNCIKDLKAQKNIIKDLDDVTEKRITNYIDESNENFLFGVLEKNMLLLYFSKWSHLYTKTLSIKNEK